MDKTRKATRAVAAHFAGAAIVIVKLPRPIGLPRGARNEQYETIRADAAMSIAKVHDLVAAQADALRPIIDEHKIIARAVHLGEFQNHAGNVSWPGGGDKRGVERGSVEALERQSVGALERRSLTSLITFTLQRSDALTLHAPTLTPTQSSQAVCS